RDEALVRGTKSRPSIENDAFHEQRVYDDRERRDDAQVPDARRKTQRCAAPNFRGFVPHVAALSLDESRHRFAIVVNELRAKRERLAVTADALRVSVHDV